MYPLEQASCCQISQLKRRHVDFFVEAEKTVFESVVLDINRIEIYLPAHVAGWW